MTGFHSKAFPVVIVGRSYSGQTDLREEFVVFGGAGVGIALGEVTVYVEEHHQG